MLPAIISAILLIAAAPEDLARSHYEAQLRGRIESVWHRPAGTEERKAEITLTLDRAGRVIAAAASAPSGSEEFDRSLLRAVQAASPFPPVPESLAKTGGEFKFVFPQPPAPPPAEIKIPPSAPARPAKPSPRKIPGTAI